VNDLIGLPRGERRKYHDDVSIVIISLDGKIWRSTPYLDDKTILNGCETSAGEIYH
jgi:hypothetical protein